MTDSRDAAFDPATLLQRDDASPGPLPRTAPQSHGPEYDECWLVRMRAGNLYWWEVQLETATRTIMLEHSRRWRAVSNGRNHRPVIASLAACIRFLFEPQVWSEYCSGESAGRRSYERYMDLLERLMADGWRPSQTDRDGHIQALRRERTRAR